MKLLLLLSLTAIHLTTYTSEKPQDLDQGHILQNQLEKSTELQNETPLDPAIATQLIAQKLILSRLTGYKISYDQLIMDRKTLFKQVILSSDLEHNNYLRTLLSQNKNAQINEFNALHIDLGYRDIPLLKPIAEKYNPEMKPIDWLNQRTQKEIEYMVGKLNIEENVELPL